MRTHHAAALLGASLLVACGGATQADESSNERTTLVLTSGSEANETGPASESPAAPIVLRSTIPVPVPQPAVAREQLSEATQSVWTRVEEQVQNVRPEGPANPTVASTQEWADGPFREWIDARRVALEETRPLLAEIPSEPPYERAVALALWAYAFEDFGAQIGGAPVPDEIARDEELRGIYIDSLNQAILPLGERAVELYADCQRRLASLGDDSEWLPWRAYCVQRGQEVIEGYRLAPPVSEPSTEPSTEPSGE